MSGIVVLVAIFIVFGIILGTIAFVAYRRVLRKAKGVERGLKMVPLLIHLPPPSDDTENSGNRDQRDVIREKISQAQVLYDLIAGTAQGGFKSSFYGQRHIAFEIVASNGLVHYFAAVPIALVGVVEQAIVTSYPGARLEEVEDHNIFNPQGRVTGTVGGELVLRHEAAYPIASLDQMERDPMSGLINALYKLQLGDGAAVQIMLRPANPKWTKRAIKLVAKKRHTRQGGLGFGALDIAKAAVKTSEEWRDKAKTFEPSKLEEQMMQSIEEKTKHPGFEVLIRVLASSSTYDRAQVLMRTITTSFALFEAPGSNGFQFVEGRDMQGLITAFIFRFFPPELDSNILNTQELAAVFHLPDAQFTPTTQVQRQQSKQVDGPSNMPGTGLLLGYNFYRGVKKEIRLSPEDRRRHFYMVGQTGTGKSTMLENLAVQDMLNGGGFAFIDPHGDTAEKLLSMVPKERAEDVIYFNPADMQQPLGLNLFEYDRPEQKDFLIQESINMLYKLYDPQKTGIIGPRFEHWYRNAALTLMADPHGSSFIEIPKVFTDTAYLKTKFKYLQDPTVIDFWTKEMGQTSDYHKSEMLGWFVSKFGAFQSNEMMRNIIGQTTSGFNLPDIMNNKKILIVNLSKGQVGELNSQLLGMIFVIKIQAAAMARAAVPEDQRPDFCLYVDEFQNFSTDSFASILSEARKYHLNLIVANQFITQLTDQIRDAVFGNIGTMLTYRCGPEDAEFLVKQFQPIFDQRDLVNLPNHNAIMKLLIGGLPSQPFSITALPPLGITHQEMGLAIKQLSAAKYGVSRQVVEADIFGRLQNSPATVVPNAATTALGPIPGAAAAVPVSAAPAPPTSVSAPTPAPNPLATPLSAPSLASSQVVPTSASTPASPPAPSAPMPMPSSVPPSSPPSAQEPAPVPALPPMPATVPTSPPPPPASAVSPPPVSSGPASMPELSLTTSAPVPAAANKPALASPPPPLPAEPKPEEVDVHAAMLPPSTATTPTSQPQPASTQGLIAAPILPPPAPNPPVKSAPDELSLNQLIANAPTPQPETMPMPSPVPPSPKIEYPSAPQPVDENKKAPLPNDAVSSSLQIGSHEVEGRISSPPAKTSLMPSAPSPKPELTSQPAPRPLPASKPAAAAAPIPKLEPVKMPPVPTSPTPTPVPSIPPAPPTPPPPAPKPTIPDVPASAPVQPPQPTSLPQQQPIREVPAAKSVSSNPPRPVAPKPQPTRPSSVVASPQPQPVSTPAPARAPLPAPAPASVQTSKSVERRQNTAQQESTKLSALVHLEHSRDAIPDADFSSSPDASQVRSKPKHKSRPPASKIRMDASHRSGSMPHLPSSRSLQPPEHHFHVSAKDLNDVSNDKPSKTMIATQRTRPPVVSPMAVPAPPVAAPIQTQDPARITPVSPPTPLSVPKPVPASVLPTPAAPSSPKPSQPVAASTPELAKPPADKTPSPVIVLPSAKSGGEGTPAAKTSVPVPGANSAGITDAYAAAAIPQPAATTTPSPMPAAPVAASSPSPNPTVKAGMIIESKPTSSAATTKPIIAPSAVAHPGSSPAESEAGPKVNKPTPEASDSSSKPGINSGTDLSTDLPDEFPNPLAAVPSRPNLRPGEIFVDEKGNVIQG